jgi:hypothetical protein
MSVYLPGEVFTKGLLGLHVARATATLPASTAGALFTVSGGIVGVTALIGEVTTVIQTQANDTKIVSNPTTGSDVDLCAALDITADEVGCLYGITGLASDALVGGGAGATVLPRNLLVIPEGTIDLNCAATNTGSVKWDLWYVPIDTGASVAAA